MSEKTVFISYRRDPTGKAFAGRIYDALKHNGYDPFLDVDSLGPGEWEKQILTQIPKRAHFLILLTPGALDRCENDEDWLRREFIKAKNSKRNIVPIKEESVDISVLASTSPKEMKPLFNFHIAELQHATFSAGISKLMTDFIPPHKAPSQELNDNSNNTLSENEIEGKQLKKNSTVFSTLTILHYLFSIMIFAVTIKVLLEGVSGNWDFAPFIPSIIGIKGFLVILEYPIEIRKLASIALFMIVCGVTMIVGNLKAKNPWEGGMWIASFTPLAFGIGIATVLYIGYSLLFQMVYSKKNNNGF